MKILFLDVDGVMNSEESFRSGPRFRGAIGIDPYMAILVNRIIVGTGCEVVLSSSWRGVIRDGILRGKENEDEVERMIGVKLFGRTEHLPLPRIRGDEIAEWLSRHPEVEKYAILDDDSDMRPEQVPHFFQTSWEIGITEEISKKVIAHLR